ncbi:MAG: HPF/RaiA family ribosome-associated protein [Acidimicrobiia bacterium]|nr:HPF/RaiA family ribosome-associated protein [Acidimicrobiia bacterium]
MKIQVNTDHNVDGSEALVLLVEAEVQSALERFEDRLTRVEVHLGDESGEKDGSGADKRCLLEARPTGMQPVVVTDFADTPEQAVVGAAQKMQSLLNSTFGRIDGRDADATIRQNEQT